MTKTMWVTTEQYVWLTVNPESGGSFEIEVFATKADAKRSQKFRGYGSLAVIKTPVHSVSFEAPKKDVKND